MKTNNYLHNRGSIVVEASLIFPIIFLAIVAVLYMCMFLYEKAYLQTLVNMTVQRGAATWNNPKKNTVLGSVAIGDLKSSGLYWRLYDFDKSERIENIKDYITKRFGAYSVLNLFNKQKIDAGKSIEVNIQDSIVYKKLVVTVNLEYKIPAGKFLKIFGLKEKMPISVKAEAVINEPTEFIRNTDFVLDLEKEFRDKNKAYKNLVEKVWSTMDNLINKAASLKFFQRKEGSSV